MKNNEKIRRDGTSGTVKSDLTDHEKNRKAFAERLKKCLPGGMSQQKAADAIGVSISGFKAWLAGRSEPGIGYMPAIEAVTGKSVQWLVTGREAPDTPPPDGLDTEVVKVVVYELCAHLQREKLWRDVRPEDMSKLTVLISMMVKEETLGDTGIAGNVRFQEIIDLILDYAGK